tara:strand:- start:153 stop:944 length:792 start_codon:yes stop_codon:yes gene_type:complete
MKKKEKPWGIFLPKGIQKIIYPQDKIDYEYGYILATFLRRISVLITYYILSPLRISPNFITVFSITLVFLISILLIKSYFFLGSVLLIFWVLLDGIDGELSRILNKQTKLGGVLEKLNSDFMYICFIPSLSCGIYLNNNISFELFIFSFFAVVIFNILRVYLSTFPSEINNKSNRFIIFIACQFKNSINLRSKNRFFSIIFYIWRNFFTQCGLMEIIFLILSLPFFLDYLFLKYFIIFLIAGYTCINLMVFFGMIIFSSITKR